jgi:hypothetical protein
MEIAVLCIPRSLPSVRPIRESCLVELKTGRDGWRRGVVTAESAESRFSLMLVPVCSAQIR